MKNRKCESIKSKIIISKLFSCEIKTLQSKLFRISYIPNKIKIFRFVIAVSKKKFNTAPMRNKVKRQIRMLIQKIDKPGFDVAIFPSPNIINVSFAKMTVDFNTIIGKLK
ncbi:MAG: hypothetical protein Ta2E_03450 [Mycoplasmoidaceae bacterium]|nr:MAG: hypothetical protein Ta2E_03450 [Mycoplasmoidaceae bacterium]